MDSSIEIWKDIEGYEGLYQVSNLGRIKSLQRNGTVGCDKVITPNGCGRYARIGLRNKKRVHFSVHRLVASAFIPNPNNFPQVDHINGNRYDNRVENLELCDRQYNIDYGTRTEKYYKAVIQESIDGEFIAEYKSVNEAAKAVGGNACNIIRYLRGGYKSKSRGKKYNPTHSYGYKWRYKV